MAGQLAPVVVASALTVQVPCLQSKNGKRVALAHPSRFERARIGYKLAPFAVRQHPLPIRVSLGEVDFTSPQR